MRHIAAAAGIATLGLLLALVIWSRWAPTHLGRSRASWKRAAACATLIDLSQLIEDFKKRQGRLPKLLSEAFGKMPPSDPWGSPIEYHTMPDGTYSLASNGPDKVLGTQDDIVAPHFDPVHPKGSPLHVLRDLPYIAEESSNSSCVLSVSLEGRKGGTEKGGRNQFVSLRRSGRGPSCPEDLALTFQVASIT